MNGLNYFALSSNPTIKYQFEETVLNKLVHHFFDVHRINSYIEELPDSSIGSSSSSSSTIVAFCVGCRNWLSIWSRVCKAGAAAFGAEFSSINLSTANLSENNNNSLIRLIDADEFVCNCTAE